jgi:hypothetical protein
MTDAKLDRHAAGVLLLQRRQRRRAEVPEVAFGCFKHTSWPRRAFICLHRSWWFDALINVTIILNTVILCAYNPEDVGNTSLRSQIVVQSSLALSAVFTVEMLVRLMAQGLYGPGAYLHDRWNWLAAAVVLLGWVSLSPNFGNLTALRLLHLVRFLLVYPGVRLVLDAITKSVPGLLNVGLLALLTYFLLAMVGLNLWNGAMAGQCGYTDPATGSWQWAPGAASCALQCSEADGPWCTPSNGDSCGVAPVPVNVTSAGFAYVTLLPTECRRAANPDWGQTSFDNIFEGMLTAFVLVTTEGWSSTMYVLWHSWGNAWFVSALLSVHVYLGAFVILELTLAFVWAEYGNALAEAKQREARALAQASRIVDTLTRSAGGGGRGSFVATGGGGGRASFVSAAGGSGRGSIVAAGGGGSLVARARAEALPPSVDRERGAPHGQSSVPPQGAGVELAPYHGKPAVLPQSRGRGTSVGNSVADGAASVSSPLSQAWVNPIGVAEASLSAGSDGPGNRRPSVLAAALGGPSAVARTPPQGTGCCASCRACCRSLRATLEAEADGQRVLLRACAAWYGRAVPPPPWWLRRAARRLVGHPLFAGAVLLMVVLNAVVLGMPYEGMSASYAQGLSHANGAFAALFAVEMLLRMGAAGVRGYFAAGFNVFDALVVLCSVTDALLDAAAPGTSGRVVAALRIVRVLRVLRLGQVLPGVRRVMGEVWAALPPALASLSLLLVAMLVFAVLGMQLFGGPAYANAAAAGVIAEVPRLNFNSLWLSLLTVFTVMDNENWNDSLHLHVSGERAECCSGCAGVAARVAVSGCLCPNGFAGMGTCGGADTPFACGGGNLNAPR